MPAYTSGSKNGHMETCACVPARGAPYGSTSVGPRVRGARPSVRLVRRFVWSFVRPGGVNLKEYTANSHIFNVSYTLFGPKKFVKI
jgi:hypothetical protein